MPTRKTGSSLLNAPDHADRVNLIKKIKVDNAWRFAPVVPDLALSLRAPQDGCFARSTRMVFSIGSSLAWV
jgi:hypothetical protein